MHAISAEGASYTSLGQRPRSLGTLNDEGLKARSIVLRWLLP